MARLQWDIVSYMLTGVATVVLLQWAVIAYYVITYVKNDVQRVMIGGLTSIFSIAAALVALMLPLTWWFGTGY